MSRKAERATEVTIRISDTCLEGDLVVPDTARGLVIFAHGSGSSRLSPRNRYVAGIFNEASLATLLFDLLTTEEEQIDDLIRMFRFDIGMLGKRLQETIDWAGEQVELAGLPVGLFGASTGAAAALIAAAERPQSVRTVVSRGGRPDLAEAALPRITVPVLLIVGGRDEVVLGMNQRAAARLRSEHVVEIVPGATHLFAEPGKLEEVAGLARDWFTQRLRPARQST